ncbi:hypothetical protein BDY17DRAFT_274047 [Neohortaea acidophila]|uniref:Transmembrane 9 superfamily member n=1 Tax=Neohortaea acidophila TaxID=245834 RepID=A0A6A6Q7D9_9PEZI|nr:uncharacterized protein BDY17DRAFT_274047 [Neohortaea acidophila]KAF2487297.1 hypothetical protein BDY17DRAFT_274047 [Neohortaea acidophila]
MRLLDLPPILSALVLSVPCASAFYLPGISPTTYKQNDLVHLDVDRLTPGLSEKHTQLSSAFSWPYYSPEFHFCQPEGGPRYVSESLGSILFGDRIMNSAFHLRMLKNETCSAVCDGVKFPKDTDDAEYTNERIRQDYTINWLIDGLPVAQVYRDVDTQTLYDIPGFALGAMNNDNPRLHNHVNLLIEYHEVGPNQYRVVGVNAHPESLGRSRRTGTGSDFTADCGDPDVPQTLSETEDTYVTWTYSVQWRPSSTVFATRWDKYLHVYDAKIHWLALVSSAVMFTFLVGAVTTILGRTLRKDIARYNRLDQLGLEDFNGTSLEEDGVVEDSGWKLVHGDVFRPPRNSLALSILVGNGAQLFMMTGFTIAFAAVGFLSPSNRGSLATVMILLYTLFGFIGGYMSARVYQYFGGTKWKQLFIFTPAAVPIAVFGTFFLLNFFVWIRGSSGAVPFTTMLVIVGIWFLISAPLSIAGSWIGFKQSIKPPPVRTNQIPRQIPPATGYLRLIPSVFAVGILPFGAIFIELFFILRSLWSNRIYYMFGFLFLSFGLLIVTSAAVTIMMIYFLLCAENYHWQWRAFISSGASAVYVFAYSLVYWAKMLSFSSLTGGLLYLGYSALISFLWFVMTGTIGFVASWVFVHRIYGSLKVD